MPRLIVCRNCTESDCTNCNMNILAVALERGYFNSLMGEQHTVQIDSELVPVRHGHWIGDFCSECGKDALCDCDKYEIYGTIHSDYCPHCGAKMDKTEECLLMLKADGSTIKIGNGHWIVDRLISDQTVMSTVYKCSECGDTSIVAYKTCPNCGVMMNEVKDV